MPPRDVPCCLTRSVTTFSGLSSLRPRHRGKIATVRSLKREEILFVAYAGWDAAGAKWFGYPTFWVNRLHLPAEQFDVTPDATGTNLDDLVTFVKMLHP
jgi:hypothetical protein